MTYFFKQVKPVVLGILILSLVFLGSAQTSNSANSTDTLDKMEEGLIDFKNKAKNSFYHYNSEIKESADAYGVNRYNLSGFGLTVLLALLLVSVLTDREDLPSNKTITEDLKVGEDVPEVESHEDLKTRINQLETTIKQNEEYSNDLLEDLGEAYRLYTLKKGDEAEKLVEEVEDKL